MLDSFEPYDRFCFRPYCVPHRIWFIALARLPSLLQKILRIRELPHVGAAKKYARPYRQAQRDVEGMQMDEGKGGSDMEDAIGLIWSTAAMSNLIPVDGSEMSLAGISRPAE